MGYVVRGYMGGSHQAHGGPVPLNALPYLERLAPDSSGNTGAGMIDLGSKETAVSTATSRGNKAAQTTAVWICMWT